MNLSEERLILCLRCNVARPLTQFRIRLVDDPTRDPELIYRPRATCSVCQDQRKQLWERSHPAPSVPPAGVSTKMCSACGEEKPLSAYYHLKSGKWGLDPRCKTCKATGEAARQKRRARQTRELRVKQTYQLTEEAWEHLYQTQGQGCGICGLLASRSALHIDHNHATRAVRGLLCPQCNSLVGFCREKTILLERAVAYLICRNASDAALRHHRLSPLRAKKFTW